MATATSRAPGGDTRSTLQTAWEPQAHVVGELFNVSDILSKSLEAKRVSFWSQNTARQNFGVRDGQESRKSGNGDL